MTEIRDVGFVGLGQMGAELARLLVGAGYRVLRVDPHVAGVDARSLAELDRTIDALCVSVPGPSELEAAVTACLALPSRLRPRHVVNFTTVGPRCAALMDARLAREVPAITFSECPVTGGVARARAHQCSVLFGSRSGVPDAQLSRLLRSVAERVLVFDGVVAASTAKLVNNVSAVSIGLATLEALDLGVCAGLPIGRLFEVLAAGTGDSYILHNSLTRALIDEDLETGFQARWALKDMRLALDLAAEVGIAAEYVELAIQRLEGSETGPLAKLSFVVAAASEALLHDGRALEVSAA